MDKATEKILAYAYSLSSEDRAVFMKMMKDSVRDGETPAQFNKRWADFRDSIASRS